LFIAVDSAIGQDVAVVSAGPADPVAQLAVAGLSVAGLSVAAGLVGQLDVDFLAVVFLGAIAFPVVVGDERPF